MDANEKGSDEAQKALREALSGASALLDALDKKTENIDSKPESLRKEENSSKIDSGAVFVDEKGVESAVVEEKPKKKKNKKKNKKDKEPVVEESEKVTSPETASTQLVVVDEPVEVKQEEKVEIS